MRWLVWLCLGGSAGATETDRLVPGLVGAISSDDAGRITAWSARAPGAAWTVLHVAEDGKEILAIDDRGNPDRAAVSPDGTRVAFVSARSGIAAVWIVRLADGAALQLTNRDLRPAAGGPPVGWVAPPAGPLRFDGASVAWSAGSVALPEGWR
jgi:hypothetical protein